MARSNKKSTKARAAPTDRKISIKKKRAKATAKKSAKKSKAGAIPKTKLLRAKRKATKSQETLDMEMAYDMQLSFMGGYDDDDFMDAETPVARRRKKKTRGRAKGKV